MGRRRSPGNLYIGESFSQQRGRPGGKLPLRTGAGLASRRAYQFLAAAVFRPTLDSLSLSSLKSTPVTVIDT